MTLFYDLETTGLDPDTARIVELAAVDGREAGGGDAPDRPGAGSAGAAAAAEGAGDAAAVQPDLFGAGGGRSDRTGTAPGPSPAAGPSAAPGPADEPTYYRLFRPGAPIPEEAARVHGITDADVADAPRFSEAAAEVQAMFEGRTLCGYNLRSFDTPLLDAELRRAGQPGLDLDAVEEIDLYRIWAALEPAEGSGYRTLEAAVERYLGRTLADAHKAAADTLVLPELLAVVEEAHGLAREEMLELSAPPEEVDRAGKLRREGAAVVFAFGRHAGEPVADHPDYVDWILEADFPGETKRILRRIREES